jgi:protein-L-isoaspartate(D-aspartate) O-methyltransferase
MSDFERARERMVSDQIAARGIRDERVLQAFRAVPREKFVQRGFEEFAYEDGALPIAANQTISQPYIVALMVAAARIKPTDRVLEVGTGSGYAMAILSQLAARVYGIERHTTLLVGARRRLEELGYDNVELREGDGTRGWPESQPFDAILVAASAPEVPATLLSQLTVGGRLIIPVGRHRFRQTLRRVTRRGELEYEQDDLGGVAFVPLIGEHGWAQDGRARHLSF